MKLRRGVGIVILVGFLFISYGCKTVDNSYGKDFKTIYAKELALALGEYEIGNAKKEVLDNDDLPDIKRLIWNVKFTDAQGKTQSFTLANNWKFQSQIHYLSKGILGDQIYELSEGDFSSAMAFIGFEQMLLIPINEANKSLLPHYISFKSLPDYILIQIFPYEVSKKDKVIEKLQALSDVSFFVVTEGFNGIIIKKGVVLEKVYKEEDVYDFPNLP